MSFLDPKTRIFDTVLTQEGKNQLAAGKLKAEFYSFTDSGAFYDFADTYASGSKDFAARPMLESSSLPQDRINFEVDDSGKLLVRELKPVGGSTISIYNGQIFSGSYGGTKTQVTNPEEFSAVSNALLSSSVENFQKLYLLGPLTEGASFDVYPTNFSFRITNDRPISNADAKEANIDHIESLFADKRLSHIPNYRFLPPVNAPDFGTNTTTPLGIFTQLGQRPIFEFSDLSNELNHLESTGYAQTINFTNTSKKNRIVGQFFEEAGSQITKLDVIDFGVFTISGKEITEIDKQRAEDRGLSVGTKHVFFVGKLFRDGNGSDTFVNMFTLVWS